MRRTVLGALLALAVLAGTVSRLGAYALVMTPQSSAAGAGGAVSMDAVYARRGPYVVGVRHLAADAKPPMDITIWYPALGTPDEAPSVTYPYGIKMFGPPGVALATFTGVAEPGAPVERSGAPYPLVVLVPGFAIGSASYAWLAEHVSSYGFVVLTYEPAETMDPGLLWEATVDRPQDLLRLLAWVDWEAAGGTLEGLVDPQRVATVGHSYGGYAALAAAGARLDTTGLEGICAKARTTHDPVVFLCDALQPRVPDMAKRAGLDTIPVGLWPEWSDPRIDAVVALAGDAVAFGPQGLAELSVPVLTIGGTADQDSPYAWGAGLTFESASSTRKVGVALDGAEHMLFAGRCDAARRLLRLLPEPFCADPAWDRSAAQTLVKHLATAFLLAELASDGDAAAALTPAAVGVADVMYQAEGY